MTENPGSRPGPGQPGGGAMSERMQALLSRAAEDQLTEQRQVSAVLADLRGLVAGLSDQLRETASSARLESLTGDLAALSTELRMSTSGLGERLDTLGRRVDEQGASTADIVRGGAEGNDALAVRVSALSADVVDQGSALDRLSEAVSGLSAFPDAISSLQREVSGLHDRLAPLGEVRSSLADLTARTGSLEALRPDVAAVQQTLEGLASSADVTRTRDSLVATLGERLDRLEQAAERPTLTAGDLADALQPVHARLEEVGSAGPVVERLGGFDQRLAALDSRLDELTAQLSDIGDAAGGVPALATDLGVVSRRMDEFGLLRTDIAAVRTTVTALQEDSPLPSLVLGVATLREDVEDLSGRVAEVTVPTAESVATVVSQQITDRVVDALAPRVADLVLSRVAGTLVAQVADSVTTSVQNGLSERVRAANVDSERRISAHVDEAVLALAEALLRRRRAAGRSGSVAPPLLPSIGTALVASVEDADVDIDPVVDLDPADGDPAGGVVEVEGRDPSDPTAPGEPTEVGLSALDELAAEQEDAALPSALAPEGEPEDAAEPGVVNTETDTDDLESGYPVGDSDDDEEVAGYEGASVFEEFGSEQQDRAAGPDVGSGADDGPEDDVDPEQAEPESADSHGAVESDGDDGFADQEGREPGADGFAAPGADDAPTPADHLSGDSGADQSPAPDAEQDTQATEVSGGDSSLDSTQAATAADDPTGDAAPLVDSSPAPASAFRAFVMPKSTSSAAARSAEDPATEDPAAEDPAAEDPAPQGRSLGDSASEDPSRESGPAPMLQVPTQTRPQPQDQPQDQWDDDEDNDDSARRRPWWRPGG